MTTVTEDKYFKFDHVMQCAGKATSIYWTVYKNTAEWPPLFEALIRNKIQGSINFLIQLFYLNNALPAFALHKGNIKDRHWGSVQGL